ncbi:salicylate synthase [Pseudonocardia sp. NPDC046786]|uniref:salicylate synthase n=1 Tax=Pseudonocardia sp. NPDC046786 TaxID=3155471 RepID=UPI0033C3CEE0
MQPTVPCRDGRAVADPVRSVTDLARAGLHEDYVVYESGEEWIYAGGVACSVRLDGGSLETVGADGVRVSRPIRARTLNALEAALGGLRLRSPWRAYGWVSFEFATCAHGRPVPRGARLAHLVVPRVEARLGPSSTEVTGDPQEVERVRAVLRSPSAGAPRPGGERVDITAGAQRYRERVRTALAEIRAGRYEKVILSRRIPLPGRVDFPGTYEIGRRANTPARSFLLKLAGLQCAGFSPELVATVDGQGTVTTNPLAGTRAYGLGDGVDRAARAELVRDPKEVYEHAISVRTSLEEMRSVARPESVVVADFMNVAERGSVQHLASTVRGRLAPGRTRWDALEAFFPAVTASGIPKAEAVEAIDRLDDPRGLYAGAVVSVSSDGALDAALVLRAVFQDQAGAWLRAGAGIVDGSRPDRELEETCEKLRSVLPNLVFDEDPTA